MSAAIDTILLCSNKECPTCRKKLVSKRSLRADPNFDKLIAKVGKLLFNVDLIFTLMFAFQIYPNRDELNAQQVRSIVYSLFCMLYIMVAFFFFLRRSK